MCSVRIHTVTENNEPKPIYFSSEHLHPADVDSLNAEKSVAEIKHEVVENLAVSSHTLAFLLVQDVEEVYEELIDDEKIPAEFIAYFDLTYIDVVRRRGARRRKEPPTFPIAVWNVNQRILQDLPITNNAEEGFHSAGRAHLNIWKLIKTLKEDKMTQILGGDPSNSCT
ncbi:Hypothetical predicted protein [Octopus vulgaris]|uniref:Uncharacterized protein n=1 Tax=Octopus vulgaris TaxID=6645 RepID=A0AA36EZ69_OCTVU|nr:Hypothetical predicted protein [Octopus vulgaris]